MGVIAKLLVMCLALIMSGAQNLKPDFRHGAIIEERGEVILVDSYIYVRVKTERTVKIPSYLYEMIFSLNELEKNIIKIEGYKEKTYEVAIYDKLGTELKAAVGRTKEKAVSIFDWFPTEKDVTNRKKRVVGVIAGIATGMVALTALTMASVNVARIENLEDLVDENSDRINVLELTSMEQDKKMNELVGSVNVLNDVVETNVFSLDITNKMFYLYMSLKGIEQELDFCINNVKRDIDKIIHAASGKVTADLIPVEILLKLLNRAHLENGFRPLYWGNSIYNYYPTMKAYLTSNEIVIEIPARTNEVFTWNKIIPFPTLVKGQDKGMMLVLDKPNILVSLSKASFAEVEDQTLEKCKIAYKQLICSHESIVTHLTSAYKGCPKSLVLNSMDDSDCQFVHAQEPSAARTTAQGTYLFFSSPTEVFLKCGNNATKTQTLMGNAHVGIGCSVRSNTWVVKATKKIYRNITDREHSYKISITSVLPELKNLNLTNIKEINHKEVIFMTRHNHHKMTLSLLVSIMLLSLVMAAVVVFTCCRPKCLKKKTVPVKLQPLGEMIENVAEPVRQQERHEVIVMS